MKIISLDRPQLSGYNDDIYTKLPLVGGAMQAVIIFRPSLSWHFGQLQFSKYARKL